MLSRIPYSSFVSYKSLDYEKKIHLGNFSNLKWKNYSMNISFSLPLSPSLTLPLSPSLTLSSSSSTISLSPPPLIPYLSPSLTLPLSFSSSLSPIYLPSHLSLPLSFSLPLLPLTLSISLLFLPSARRSDV